MNKLIILVLIATLFVLAFVGVDYMKKASTKAYDRGSSAISKNPFNEGAANYYNPVQVWSDPVGKNYTFKEQEVSDTKTCRMYTYESSLVSEKYDSTGNLNTLSNVTYARPSLSNCMDDFVNGINHLTGERTDPTFQCYDADQIYAQYTTKTCQKNTIPSWNVCLTQEGTQVDGGVSYEYTQKCDLSPCENSQVGCISLNYSDNGTNVNANSYCIEIKKITVTQDTLDTYFLDIFQELGIIDVTTDRSLIENGYPVELGFAECDTIDARQKFKISRFGYQKQTQGQEAGFYGNKNGNYAGFIFRGLNSYLDFDTSLTSGTSFILRPMNEETDSIKWILLPETPLFDNYVPSSQRCELLQSNITNAHGFPLKISVGTAYPIGKKLLKPGQEPVPGDDSYTYYNPEFLENADSLGSVTVEDLALEIAEDVAVDLVEDEAAEVATDGYLGPLGYLVGPLLSIMTKFIPNPSYGTPPITSKTTNVNQTVSPTNFENDITANGPGSFGTANPTPIEHYCKRRMLPNYPPYYLQASTPGTTIDTQYINYAYERAYTISADNVITPGQNPAYGLFIWRDENNLDVSHLNNTWQDGDTVWQVLETLGKAIEFPRQYFFRDLGSVNQVKENSTDPKIDTSYYKISKTGQIFSLNLNSKTTQEERFSTGRLPGNYNNVPCTSDIGTSATFDVTVVYNSSSLKTTTTFVRDIVVNNRGSGYTSTSAGLITINGSDIGGLSSEQNFTFTPSEVGNEIFVFKSLYLIDQNGTESYVFPVSTFPASSTQISGGFEIAGSVFGDGTVNFIGPAINNGFGYKVGDTIFLAQYDQDDNKVSSQQSTQDTSQFYQLTVESIEETSYSVTTPAPQTLLPSSSNFFSLDLNYNFMDNAPNVFLPSPQQIAYGGEVDPATGKSLIQLIAESNLIKDQLTAKGLGELFLDSTDKITSEVGTGILSPLNIKTLQVNTIKYTSDENLENIDGSSIILGRYIPYQAMTPATKRISGVTIDQQTGLFDTESDKGNLFYGTSQTYFNHNYAQIIPYGVQNVYNNEAFVKNAPKF